jgi:hypothetical protein
MSNAVPGDTQAASNDSAWASVNTPLPVSELKKFCKDIIRLYRINPMLEFNETRPTGEHTYFLSGRNISQETPFDFETSVVVKETENGFEVHYDKGIRSSTSFIIEESEFGSKLTITDSYDRIPESERKSHLGEVDKSLVNWAEYLQRFIITWKKWRWLGVWRWYMRKVWQPMKPTARRITYMIWWITVIEIALIALGVGIYFAEFA